MRAIKSTCPEGDSNFTAHFLSQTWLTHRLWTELKLFLFLGCRTCCIHLTRVSVPGRRLRSDASAVSRRGAAAGAAALRRARAVLHLPLERHHGGAALPRHHTVGSDGSARKVGFMRQFSVCALHHVIAA